MAKLERNAGDRKLTARRTFDERLWPINVALVVLGGLTAVVILFLLRWDDTRLLYNAWTWLTALPIVIGLLVWALAQVDERAVNRAAQLAALLSVILHLSLFVTLAARSRQAWPGRQEPVDSERPAVRQITVPDYQMWQLDPTQPRQDFQRPVETPTPQRALQELNRAVTELATAEPPQRLESTPPPNKTVQAGDFPRREVAVSMPSDSVQPPTLRRRTAQRQPPLSEPVTAPATAVATQPTPPPIEPSERAALPRDRAELPDTPLVANGDGAEVQPALIPRVSQTSIDRIPTAGQPMPDATIDLPAISRRPTARVPNVAIEATPIEVPRQPPTGAGSQSPPLDVNANSTIVTRRAPLAPLPVLEETAADRPTEPTQAHSTAAPELIRATPADRALASPPTPAAVTPRSRSATVPPLVANVQAAMSKTADAVEVGDPDRGFALKAAPTRQRRARLELPPRLEDRPVGPSPGEVPANARNTGRLDRVLAPRRIAARPSAELDTELDVAKFRDRAALSKRVTGDPPALSTTAVVAADAYLRRSERKDNDGDRPSPETEKAIESGLDFLARHQSPQGSWSLSDFGAGRLGYENERANLRSDTAATGLALLAFLGAGYHHRGDKHAEAVDSALRYLVRNQKEDGDLFAPQDQRSNGSVWLYSHGIATISLCEAYGMTQDAALREPAQKALDFIVTAQHARRGGWRYSPNFGSDTSVTGWLTTALKSGELANLHVPRQAYDRIERWLDMAQVSATERHLYRYNPLAPNTSQQVGGRRPNKVMTAVGLLMRLYLGWRTDSESMIDGADYLLAHPPALGTPGDPQRDTYYWFYATQVMFQMKGEYWEAWNRRLHPLLVNSQVQQGPMAGSWHPRRPVPDRWAPHAGRIYVTTMNLLSLEVYYRHLPIYEETALKAFPDHNSAKELLNKISAPRPPKSQPEADPVLLFMAVEQLLRQARAELDAVPEVSVRRCDEAILRLDELSSLPGGANGERASRLRRHVLLARARANARLNEWEDVRDSLAQLKQTLNGGQLQDPAHRVVRSSLAVLADYSVPSRESAAPVLLLERLEANRRTWGGVESTSQVAAAQWEQDEITRLVKRHADPLRAWLRQDGKQPLETRLKFCDTLLAYLPDDRETLDIQAGINERISGAARPASSDARDKIVAAINDPTRPDYADLLEDIEALPPKDRADGLIQTFRAECLIEAAGPSALTPRSWRQIRNIALDGGATVEADYRPYQHYVQALVYHTEPERPRNREAAELMAQALADEAIPAALQGHRQAKAAKIFETGATRLSTAAPDRPFLKMLESPYPNPQDAGTALAWLAKAATLTVRDKQSPTIKRERVLAAWYNQPPDGPLASRLAKEVIAERGDRPIERGDLPMLYVLARSLGNDATGRTTAIERYAEILNLLEQEPSPGADDVDPLELFEKVVGPAVTLADGLSGPGRLKEDQRRRVGSVYAAKGRLLRENQYENWEFDALDREMFDAYSKAIEFDSSRPQYYVGRGHARMRLADFDLAAVRGDAENAIERDAEYPGGHALLGKAQILQSRREGDVRRRMPLLKSAVEASTLAVDHSEKDDPNRADYLINRSAAYLEWANFTVDPTLKRQAELFERARADAKQAAEMESVYQDYAYRALGNALEDLAWIARKPKYYPDAIEAFSRAIELRGDLATAWMDRGRCYFKSVAHDGLADGRLDAAVSDLNEAVVRQADMAEGHLWLGRVYHYRGQYDEADRVLASALKIDPTYHPAAFWKANVAVARGKPDVADPLFAQAVNSAGQEKSVRRLAYLVEWARTVPPTDPQPKRVAPLRAAADRLAGDATPEAGLFVARARRTEKRWDEAIAACDSALEGQPTVPGVMAMVYLARSESRYQSQQASADLKKAESLIIADADQATRLAADANTKAVAYSQAAQARLKAANELGTAGGPRTAALRREAVDNYRQAIKLAPDHPQGWYWRWLLYTSWVTVEPRLHENNAKFNEAMSHLNEAYNRAPNRGFKDRIGRMRLSLQANRGP